MTEASETHDNANDDDSSGADAELTPALDDDRVASRAAGLTAEEKQAGSDDPEAQARAILADSEDRMIEQSENPEDSGERRTSDEATEPL